MQILNRLPLFFVMACLFLCCTAQAFAAPTLTISSSGNGVFVLQGNDFQVVGGAKVTVRYDTSTLINPRVTQGGLTSGAIFLPSTNTKGVVLMGLVAINGISGSGVIATINFDLPGSSPGVIQSLQVDVIDLKGELIPSQLLVINPTGTVPKQENAAGPSGGSSPQTEPAAQETTADTAPQASSQPDAVGASPVPGLAGGSTVVLPGEAEATKPPQPAEDVQETIAPAGDTPDTATAAPDIATAAPVDAAPQEPERQPAEAVTPSRVAYKSVLEQFRTFAGEKTPQALTGIFTRHTMPGISQEPAVGLTDGASKLRLSITLQSPGKNAPMYSLQNVKLVALKIESDGNWLIELLPTKDIHSATLTMLQSGAETEIPLLVAPPLPSGTGLGSDGKLSEADFARFLAERGTDKAPRFDLNNDGKRDYIDDYIFTANYLHKKR